VQGTFERAGDSDWYRVTLKGGKDYAFAVRGECIARLSLRTTGGKVLRSVSGGDAIDSDNGFEFRSARTLTYLVELRDDCAARPGATYPAGYRASVTADARGDTRTRATIAVGQTVKGFNSSTADADFFRTRLSSGRTYTLIGEFPSFLAVQDAKGRIIAGGAYGAGPPLTGFTVPRTGTWYVVVSTSDDFGDGPYTLRLTSP
jgi:hypothetical protein